mmetsp:Transcript_20281/g.34543  ORF Transcript_20281/g.34543 Transcript_20281/m.34543 type:complete len:198 (-) Transcript_20281:52-645(-)
MSDEIKQCIQSLAQTKNKLQNVGSVSFLPIVVTGKGRYHIIFHGDAIILCYNSENGKSCFIKVKIYRKTTSGPSTYSTSVDLVTFEDGVQMELIEGDDNVVKVNLSQVTQETKILSTKTNLDYMGQVIGKKDENSYELIEDYFPSSHIDEIIKILQVQFSRREPSPEVTLEEFKETFGVSLPDFRCSWKSKAKSARK